MLQTLITSKTRLRLLMKFFLNSNACSWLIGSFARGLDSPMIDILLIGTNIDRLYLAGLIEKAETLISRKIRYAIITFPIKESILHQYPEAFLLWEDVE